MNFRYALRNALNTDMQEAFTFIGISILSGFILSFRMWGTDKFDLNEGLTNLMLYSVIFLILFFIFIYSEKFVAGLLGLEAKIYVWKYGPPIGILVTLFSWGFVPLIFMGGVQLKEIPRLRLGRFRVEALKIKEMAIIGMVGPLALIFLSLLLFFPLYKLSNNAFFLDMIKISSLILVVSALPLPSLNGINVILWSRTLWMMYFLYALFLYVMLLFIQKPFVYALILIIALFTGWMIKIGLTDDPRK